MTTTIKTISYAAIAAICMFALVVPQVFANHTWSKYHWDISTDASIANPLKLGDNLNATWDGSLMGASTDWNQSVLKNEIIPGAGKVDCGAVLGQVEVCNDAYGEVGWLGIAQIWTYRGKDGHIAQGVVKLNDTYFNLPQYNTQAWRNMVTCQEVGHTFGLGHQDENFYNDNLGTCMDYTTDPASNQHPNQHDYDTLTEIYAHLNSPPSDGGGGGGKPDKGNGGGKGKPQGVGQDVDLSNPSQWGSVSKRDAQGNPSLYVRNLGNGQYVYTHVTWVDGYEVTHED